MDREELCRVLDGLQGRGVDTTQEKELIQPHTGTPVMLVAGTHAARPLDLLQGLEIRLPAEFTPSFPVRCVYGEAFHIQAQDRKGERHHFSGGADFYGFLEAHPEQIVSCTLSAPAPFLARTQLCFLILDAGAGEKLARFAADCRGFLAVLPCAAGAPGDAVEELCRWVRDIRVLPDRMGAVLHHTETGMTNAMLSIALDHWMGVEVPCWRCGYPAFGKSLPPLAVLEQAAQRLAAADTAGADGQVLAGCRQRAADKALALEKDLERKAEEKREAAAWLLQVSGDFRANAENAGAVLRCTLTDRQEKAIREDIAGMAALLQEELPGMTRELLEQRGADTKEDLKNLGGDYIEEVCNRYLSALVDYIGRELWQPKIREIFRQAVEEYRTLVRGAPESLLKADPEGMSRTLKAIDVNLGEYQDPTATGLGSAAGKALYFGINLLLRYGKVDAITRRLLSDEIKEITQFVGQKVALAADWLMPPKAYAEKFTRLLQEIVSKMPAKIYDTLTTSVIPMINADIAQQYQAMIDQACGMLRERADALSREKAELEGQRDELEGYRLRLLEA